MKFSSVVRKAALSVVVLAMGIGLSAAPAFAAEGSGGAGGDALTDNPAAAGQDVVPAPDGVSKIEWSEALSDAQAEFGTGDKAYLEALKSVNLLSYAYCDRGTRFKAVSYPGEFGTVPTYYQNKDCVLESGNLNNGVYWLQVALNNCYSKGLALDGDFGPATYNALMQVQSSLGLAVDGVYGPNTRQAMKLSASVASGCLVGSQISNNLW